jgi:hypothetical protein
MAFPSAPRALYGVHSFTPYSRTDATPYGTLKVLKSSSLSLSGSVQSLMGGSSKYPWAVEEGEIKAELSLKFGQYEDFLFTLFLGKAPTALSAETSGNVSTLTNYKGSTAMSATIGIASATALSGSEANLKFAKFTVVVVSATTVDVYASSDVDFGRGTNGSFTTDTLKIAAAQSIASGATTDFTSWGFKLTGGSGTIGMTVGDSATFYTRPIANAGGMTVVIGGTADQAFPEFGAIVMSNKRGNQEMFEIDLYRCKAVGMPLNFEQNAWSESEVKIQCLYDTDLDGVMQIRHTRPSGS